jgi:hypothetical protein
MGFVDNSCILFGYIVQTKQLVDIVWHLICELRKLMRLVIVILLSVNYKELV